MLYTLLTDMKKFDIGKIKRVKVSASYSKEKAKTNSEKHEVSNKYLVEI